MGIMTREAGALLTQGMEIPLPFSLEKALMTLEAEPVSRGDKEVILARYMGLMTPLTPSLRQGGMNMYGGGSGLLLVMASIAQLRLRLNCLAGKVRGVRVVAYEAFPFCHGLMDTGPLEIGPGMAHSAQVRTGLLELLRCISAVRGMAPAASILGHCRVE